MKTKNQIANIITFSRIIFCIPLLFTETFSVGFYVFYLLCGISDMIDGTIARKTHSESKFGERLDSIADFTFVLICIIKVFPKIQISRFFIIWIVIIAVIKICNVIIGLIIKKKIISLHTILNKITGFILFIFPLTIPFIQLNYSLIFCCIVASVTALNESFLIKT